MWWLVHHHLMLGPYFGDIDRNDWPHTPLHKEPTVLEDDFNQLMTNITFKMSNETLKGISILDLPSFGSTIATLRKELKEQFLWPTKANFATLGTIPAVEKTKISTSYKTLQEDWAYYMTRLNDKDYRKYFTSEMEKNFERFQKISQKISKAQRQL